MYPEIHDLARKIMLAGNACDQDVHRADGLKLVDLVNRFAEIYWATNPAIDLGHASEHEIIGVRSSACPVVIFV